MKTEFTTPEIEITLGIPRARLKEWIAEVHIVPSVQVAGGRGTKHIFSKDDLYVIALYKELLEHGVRRALAGDVVQRFAFAGVTFSEAIDERFRYLAIFRWTHPEEEPTVKTELLLELPPTLHPDQEYIWAFNLQNIKKRVDSKLA